MLNPQLNIYPIDEQTVAGGVAEAVVMLLVKNELYQGVLGNVR